MIMDVFYLTFCDLKDTDPRLADSQHIHTITGCREAIYSAYFFLKQAGLSHIAVMDLMGNKIDMDKQEFCIQQDMVIYKLFPNV